MLARTQIVLDAELHRRARAKATALRLSLAEYVRRLVAADLEAPALSGAVAEVFDLGDSGGSDIAAHQDAYLAEALAADRLGRR